MTTNFTPRPSQQNILRYNGGRLGIAAVPGAGKTHIRLALTLLESDEEFLERLRYRYPFILEDEAQDSSQTQERILDLLSGGTPPPRPFGTLPPFPQ